MKTLNVSEWETLVKTKKLTLFSEIQTDYNNGIKVNEDAIYALNRANALVAFYDGENFVQYSKPIGAFSKTKRKFIKVFIKVVDKEVSFHYNGYTI